MSSYRSLALWQLVCRRGGDQHKAEYRRLRDAIADLERQLAEANERYAREAHAKMIVLEQLSEARAELTGQGNINIRTEAQRAAIDAERDRLASPALTAEPQAVPEGLVLVPQSALDWLMGAGPDHNGNWFGEGKRGPGAFWWRSKFTAMCRLPSSPHKEGSGDA